MENIAIVGTGVAGLACAWHLRDVANLTLLEKNSRPGGHTNTVTIEEDGTSLAIDTGFIVFNKVTYPNLVRLFQELDVAIKPSEMSFSVQHIPTGLEYNGMGLNKVYAQRRNLLKPRFHALLASIFRFFRVANAELAKSEENSLTMREFALQHKLGPDFLELYLVPMCSAVWSTDPVTVLDFPAATLIRFFHNHGFLGVSTHHPWFTVEGGAKTYVNKILSATAAAKLSAGVTRVEEKSPGVLMTLENGDQLTFDRVILACHADESLALLAQPTAEEQRLLAPFQYQHNHAILHTDESVMPRKRRAWAAWNYRLDRTEGNTRATTHYWMNALQGVSQRRNYFVSLNSGSFIREEKRLYQTDYEHPVFTNETARAQKELPSLNTRSKNQRLFFCGSYFRYGFHEDACLSGLDAARAVTECLSS